MTSHLGLDVDFQLKMGSNLLKLNTCLTYALEHQSNEETYSH